MNAVVTSDLHLGSPDLDRDAFVTFLDALPPDAALIMNGDTLHILPERMGTEDLSLLDRLLSESARRKLIWVCGNHDVDIEVPGADEAIFRDEYLIDGDILAIHGHQLMPLKPLIKLMVRLTRPLALKIKGEHFMSAKFVRTMPRAYKALQDSVARRGLRCAAERSLRAVICGHLHEPYDITRNGVRYINTGTWAEHDPHCAVIMDGELSLIEARSL